MNKIIWRFFSFNKLRNSLVLSKESMYQPSKAKVTFRIVLHILSMHPNSGLSWRRTPVLDSEFFTLQPENFLHLVNFILWPIYYLPKYVVKSSFSKKATKIWKNIQLVLTLLSKNNCFVKIGRRFFKFCGLLIMSELYLFL